MLSLLDFGETTCERVEPTEHVYHLVAGRVKNKKREG